MGSVLCHLLCPYLPPGYSWFGLQVYSWLGLQVYSWLGLHVHGWLGLHVHSWLGLQMAVVHVYHLFYPTY